VEANRVLRRRGSNILDNRLTDGGKVVSLTRRPPFTPKKIFVRDYVDLRVIVLAGRIMSIEKSSELLETETRDLPACSIVS
jgi:hypothetical protein